jgi:hypothetical protein
LRGDGTSEDDDALVRRNKQTTGSDHTKSWARQGQAWDDFVDEMWRWHRSTFEAPIDGWKEKHDKSYQRSAIEKSQE